MHNCFSKFSIPIPVNLATTNIVDGDWLATQGQQGYIKNKPNVIISLDELEADENGNISLDSITQAILDNPENPITKLLNRQSYIINQLIEAVNLQLPEDDTEDNV